MILRPDQQWCETCDGERTITVTDSKGYRDIPCPDCEDGIVDKRCPDCDGQLFADGTCDACSLTEVHADPFPLLDKRRRAA